MTVSEYEERFRASAPSLHETFTGMRGPSRGRRLRWRLWTAAVLAGAVITDGTPRAIKNDAEVQRA